MKRVHDHYPREGGRIAECACPNPGADEPCWALVPLPAARISRSSRAAGGLLACLWTWLWLSRVERFRRCARCGLVRDEDRVRAGRPMRTCTGWIGESYNRCMSAQYRLG